MTHVNPHDLRYSTYIVELGADKFAAYRGSYMLAKGSLEHVRKVIRGERDPLAPLADYELYPGRKIRPRYRGETYRIEYTDDDGKRRAELVNAEGTCLGILKPVDFPAGKYAAHHALDRDNVEATVLIPDDIDAAPGDLVAELFGNDALHEEAAAPITIDTYERI